VRQWVSQRRIARSLVALLFLTLFQSSAIQSPASAATLSAPTITSITAGDSTLTVNMVTAGNSGNFWTYQVLRRDSFSACANPYGDSVNTNTGSLSATISLTGLTNGCSYLIRVASNLSGVGNFAEAEGMPTNFGNYLSLVWMNDSGSGVNGINRFPYSSGCKSETVTTLNYSLGNLASPGGTCNTTNQTGYFSGYVKAPFTGSISFTLSNTDDAGVLAIQGNTVVTQGGGGSASGTVAMIANQVYRIEFWFHNDGGPGASSVTWTYNGGSATTIPASNLANDPSVLAADGGCSIGMAARCAAGSAWEIKQATGTNFDGQYWISINGTATLVYCIMNSVEGGGGWMLAMRGKNSASTFNYESAYWTNGTLTNNSYPERFSTTDTYRNTDAKYAPFTSIKGGQILALFPEVNGSSQTGGAYANNSNSNGGQVNVNSAANVQKYGFAWSETYSANMVAWTTYNASTGFGGNSSGYSLTNAPSGSTAGPTGTSNCPNTVSTLQSLFSNSVRCAFRQVKSAFDVNESPYSVIGNNIFFSQTNIRFFGINYGGSSTADLTKARFGFGWNENGDGDESSGDGAGGIGLYDSGKNTLAAGTYNGCCSGSNAYTNADAAHRALTAGQTGISGGDNTSTDLGFELYVRNQVSAPISGLSTVRITAGRTSGTTVGQSYSQSVTAGSAVYRISPMRAGFSIESTTGTMKVSGGLVAGTYYETVTATDGNGASAAIPVTINVVGDSRETDTALSFNGSSQYISTSQTFTNTGDFTVEMWAKPGDGCTGATNFSAILFVNIVIFCRGGFWYQSVNTSGATWSETKLNAVVRANEWVHLAVVRSSNVMRAYVNNVNVNGYFSSAWVQSWTEATINSSANNLFVGGSGGAGQYFNGVIDEVKIFKSARSISTIWANANTQESLNNADLVAYYDFNDGIAGGTTGTATNRAQSSSSSSDMNVNGPIWTNISTTTISGPYTVVIVPRSIINSIGGWKVPESVTAITVDVIGGGGGGGGGYQGGGGGGGGFQESTLTISPKSIYPIQVGVGGRGVVFAGSGPLINPTNGDTSTAFGISSAGGGAGGIEVYATVNTTVPAINGGSGGGGVWGNFTGGSPISGQGFAGGNSKRLESGYNGCVANNYVGAGGGGAGAVGQDAQCTKGGDGGAGKLAVVTNTYLAGGGGGSLRASTTTANQGAGGQGGGGSSAYLDATALDVTGGATSGGINTGGGGGAGISTTGQFGSGANGGAGVVAFRYINAFKPSFTYPTNANLDVGQTESFTTNVSADSATAVLTRTFRWESTTTGSGGTYSLIKQGAGASNAAFAWVPTDTSTSGSNYLYRVIVTDSDTAGLFIQDTSTAVFATINKTMLLTSKSTLTKTTGVSKTETFTVTLGTPTYSYSLKPTSDYFWLDTSTVGSPRIKFADTVTVGTYYETFTVTDSVSASITVPLTIIVSTPPSFSASSALVDSGTVLYLDAGNSASHPGRGVAWNDISGRGLIAYETATVTNLGAVTSKTCTAPAYSKEANGSLSFNSASQNCAYIAGLGVFNTYTAEAWIKPVGNQVSMASIFANPWNTDTKINIVIEFTGNSTITAGIYNGGGSWYTSGDATVTLGAWTHVLSTYDGATLKLYINGVYANQVSIATTFTGDASIRDGMFIGRRWDGDNYFNGLIASARIYNRTLTLNEIQQNYNATKDRFAGTLNENVIAKKYASQFVDTYTVTSGSESLTATFTNNALAGVKWETTTARSIVLTLQDTLTPGTYYDTITATDIYGSSSKLPLTFTISKADTITVFIDTPTALSYTGSKAAFTQTLKVTGLIGLETGTSTSATVKFKPGGGTCATGGYCRVGDIGPGGGIVFIDTSTASSDGRIYEVAPANWSGTDDLSTVATYCSNNTLNLGATQIGIGWGDTNTSLAKSQCLGGAVAKVNTFNQSNATGYSDWFIPGQNEAAELIKIPAQAGLVRVGANYSIGTYGYWTSTEVSATDQRSIGGSGASWNASSSVAKSDSTHNMVRPVRAFKSCWAIDTCTAISTTDTPTVGGVYSIVPSALAIGTGSLNNYAAINYVATNLTINKIAPAALNIPWINTSYPDTFTVSVAIAAGTGNLTFTTTNGTASGCALDYRKIYTTTQGTCNLTIVRAADRNYLADTSTGTILFLAYNFAINQPTSQVGSGSGIGLNGVTSFETSTVSPPSITGLSTLTLSLGAGGTFTINGTGFNAGGLTVKFWRNKYVTPTGSTATTITFNVSDIGSSGAASGRIAVTTVNGQVISVDSLTISP
jgi:hypothetical protein